MIKVFFTNKKYENNTKEYYFSELNKNMNFTGPKSHNSCDIYILFSYTTSDGWILLLNAIVQVIKNVLFWHKVDSNKLLIIHCQGKDLTCSIVSLII